MQFLYFVKSACKFNKFIAAKNIKTYIFIPFYKALLQVLTTPMRIGNRNESLFFSFSFSNTGVFCNEGTSRRNANTFETRCTYENFE